MNEIETVMNLGFAVKSSYEKTANYYNQVATVLSSSQSNEAIMDTLIALNDNLSSPGY